MKILRLLDHTEEVVSALCLAAMAVVIGMQVFNRYVLEASLVWSEELGRYLFIWAVFVGCAYASRENRHLAVTFVRDFSGARTRTIILTVAHLLTLVFCALCVYWGFEMLQLLARTGQQTQALKVSIGWVYLALPVGMALMALRTVQRLWHLYAHGPEPSNSDQAQDI